MATCHPIHVIDYRVILDFESSNCYGTAPGTPNAVLLPLTSLDITETQLPQQNASLLGRYQGPPFYSNKTVAGTLIGPVDPLSHYYPARAALGAPVSYSGGKYTFKNTSSPESFILEKQFAELAQYYKNSGCMVNTYNVAFSGTGGQLLYNLTLMAQKETYSKTSYDSSPIDYRFSDEAWDNRNVQLYIDDVAADVAIDTFSFTLTNGVVLGYGLNGTGAATVAGVGSSMVNGTLGGMFFDDTLLKAGRDHTTKKLEIKATRGTQIISWIFPEVQLSHESPPMTGNTPPVLALTWNAFYSESSEECLLQVEITTDETYSTTSTTSSSSSTSSSSTTSTAPAP